MIIDKNWAMLRAIASLRANGDEVAAQALEDSLKIDGTCQYCGKELTTQIEMVTLQDTCEWCYLIKDIHPATLKRELPKMIELYERSQQPGD